MKESQGSPSRVIHELGTCRDHLASKVNCDWHPQFPSFILRLAVLACCMLHRSDRSPVLYDRSDCSDR